MLMLEEWVATDSRLTGGGAAGAAAEGAVGAGGGGFGGAGLAASSRAETGGHPFAGAEDAFKEGRHPEVGVELWEVEAEAGGGYLDLAELGGGGVFEALRVFRGEDADADGELQDNASGIRSKVAEVTVPLFA